MKKKIRGRETAVALNYDSERDVAPKVVAIGQGNVAKKIIEKGEESDIPIYKDEKLVSQLAQMEMGNYIPETLYEAVAQVLVFIAEVDSYEG